MNKLFTLNAVKILIGKKRISLITQVSFRQYCVTSKLSPPLQKIERWP